MAKSKMKRIEMRHPEKPVIAKYIRVSTDKQREEGFSVEIQKERLAGYVASMFPGAKSIEYVDDGYSGGSLDRPMMRKLIEDAKARAVTHVVVIKLDRLSRSQKDTLYLIEDVFLPHDVAFISMGESFNTETAFGRAVLGILSVFAQLERENIFERTRSGMQKRVELGYWPGGGRVPFGYDYDPEQGILVPNQDAETVRRVYELYLKGYSMQYIADLCGLKYDRLAQQILTRKSNTGCIVYNGAEYPGRHEPLVSPETYEKAMRMMAERSARRFVSTTEHLLTGLVYCGSCGAKMRYQKWGKAGYKLVCYSQQRSKPYLVKDPDCKAPKVWADEVEEAVVQSLFSRTADIEAPEGGETEETDPLTLLRESRGRELSKLKRLYDLYSDGGDEALLAAIDEAKRELAAIDRRIELGSEQQAVVRDMDELRAELRSVRGLWPHMTVHEKQNILRSAIRRITIYADSSGQKGEIRIGYYR